MDLCNNHTVFTLGVCDNAESKCITEPTIPELDETSFVSKVPSGNITLHLWSVPLPIKPLKSWALSTVIWVLAVFMDFSLPDLLTPLLTGSLILITLPGLTIAPASIEVVKLTTSDSCCSLNNIALPNLNAWPLDVQAKAFTSFFTMPNFAIAAVSSTTS